MNLAVEFPSISYREGHAAVAKMAKGIEDIGYDQLDVYDHVVMGYDIEGRTKSYYPAQMPIIEAFMMLSYAAAVTERIGLGTEVLVLPQRQPALVAKQSFAGYFVEWQGASRYRRRLAESEYEALGENFKDRGRRMDGPSTCGLTGAMRGSTSRASIILPRRWQWSLNRLKAALCRCGLAVTRPRLSGGSAKKAMAGSLARSVTRISPSAPWTQFRRRRWPQAEIPTRSDGKA